METSKSEQRASGFAFEHAKSSWTENRKKAGSPVFTEQRGQTNLKIICVEHSSIFLLSPLHQPRSICPPSTVEIGPENAAVA